MRNVFTQMRKTGRVRRGEIGVHAQTITPVIADALGVESEAAVVLADGRPGWRGRSRRPPTGDVVTLDGKRMENRRQFASISAPREHLRR